MTNGEIADVLETIAERVTDNRWRARAYARAARVVSRHPVAVATMGAAELQELPGIGSELAKIIVEIAATGRAGLLDTLPAKGARRSRGREREGPLPLWEALRIVPELVAYLRAARGVRAVEAVGAFRRQAERVARVELLAAAEAAGPVLERFAAHAGLEEIAVDEDGRARGRLRHSVPVELRVVPPRAWGTALVEGTGSPAHAAALLARAPGPRAEEADVYRAAGVAWVPPELREDAAALDRRPPRHLVTPDEIRGDLQMHTEWSDGNTTIARMAAACRRRGYEYLAITDHSGSLTIAGGLTPADLQEQWREIDEVRASDPGITLLRSMEVDILPDGTLDLLDEHLAALDCVLVAVHVQQKLPRAEQTRRILRAIEHPSVDILGHPTGKRGRRPSYDVDLEAVLRRCAELDVAVELDCSPDRSDLSAENVRRALDLGCTIVIDTDAHSASELEHMGYGVGQARRAAAERDRVLNARPWASFKKWLERRGRVLTVS